MSHVHTVSEDRVVLSRKRENYTYQLLHEEHLNYRLSAILPRRVVYNPYFLVQFWHIELRQINTT